MAAKAPVLLANTGYSTFLRMDESKGLVRKSVPCITQDHQGFLWVGTTDGLGRYDGYGFTIYRPQRTPGSLSHPTIRDLIVDPDGSLWVATWGGGLNRFDPKTETFSAFRHSPTGASGLSDDRVTSIAQAADGAVWAGSPGNGLSRLNPSTGQVTVHRHREDDASSLADNFITRLLVDASGRLWVATLGGLDLYHPETETFTHALGIDKIDKNRDNTVRIQGLAGGAGGNLWLATTRGLIHFDPETGNHKTYRHDPDDPSSLGQDILTSVALDEKGDLWIGTSLRGIDHLQKDGTFVHERHRPTDFVSLYEGSIQDLFFDRAGILWVGSSGGLLQSNPLSRVFSRHTAGSSDPASLPDGAILALHEDPRGDLWIGTNEGLAIRQEDGRLLKAADLDGFPKWLHEDKITTFYQDKAEDLWIGTANKGLFRRRAAGGFTHYAHDAQNPSSLGSNDVPYLLEDSAGRFWVGTWGGGLNLLDRDSGHFTRYRQDPENPSGLNGDAAFVIHESPPGVLWIGTWVSGLARFEPGPDPEVARFEHFRYNPDDISSLGSNRVHDIHGELEIDSEGPGTALRGILWIATWGGGLNRFDAATGSFRSFTTADGMPSDSLYTIRQDDSDKLWISTTQGLVQFDPAKEEIHAYDTSDGVQDSLFYYHCGLRFQDGTLAFCGSDGYTSFQPSEVVDRDVAPAVVLTHLEVLGKPIDHGQLLSKDDHLDLAWSDRLVTVTVAALDFAAPHKNRYSYRLPAHGNDWVNLGTRRDMTFPSLPAGEHVVQVRGMSSRGFGAEDGLTLRFRVAPPWWGTWTFRSAVVVLFALMLFVGHSLRMRSVRQRSRELEEEVLRRRQAELESEQLITKLESKNTELAKFSSIVAHDFKSPLFTISAFLGYVDKSLEKGDDQAARRDLVHIRAATGALSRHLEALHGLAHLSGSLRMEENVDLGKVASQAAELVRGRLLERRVEITLSPALPTATADRARLLQVFQNLIDNAAKFMPDEQTEPRIEVFPRNEAEETVIVVRDNGIGLAVQQLDRVFDLFHRVDKEVEGTGVGLALVKQIIDLHDGRIWVESDGPGRGCAFCFTVQGRRGRYWDD